MKKLALFFLFVVITAVSSKAEAGIVIYHNGPTFNIVEKLPSDCTIDGKHVNLAVTYDQFGLFWMPLWNYGTPGYILLADDEKEYWESDKEVLENLKSDFNISVPNEPSPSLWNKIGLKPVVVLALLGAIWSIFSSPKDEIESTNEENQQIES